MLHYARIKTTNLQIRSVYASANRCIHGPASPAYQGAQLSREKRKKHQRKRFTELKTNSWSSTWLVSPLVIGMLKNPRQRNWETEAFPRIKCICNKMTLQCSSPGILAHWIKHREIWGGMRWWPYPCISQKLKGWVFVFFVWCFGCFCFPDYLLSHRKTLQIFWTVYNLENKTNLWTLKAWIITIRSYALNRT